MKVTEVLSPQATPWPANDCSCHFVLFLSLVLSHLPHCFQFSLHFTMHDAPLCTPSFYTRMGEVLWRRLQELSPGCLALGALLVTNATAFCACFSLAWFLPGYFPLVLPASSPNKLERFSLNSLNPVETRFYELVFKILFYMQLPAGQILISGNSPAPSCAYFQASQLPHRQNFTP